MATTPEQKESYEGQGFRVRAAAAISSVTQHPRLRDTALPAWGVGLVVLGTTLNILLALGCGILAFTMLDRRR
jgi:hypothetical protein